MNSETALLLATRDLLRIKLGELYQSENINIELDPDTIPTIAANGYLAIIPGTVGVGANNQPGAIDDDLNLSVYVYKRVTNVPRDRRRDVFLAQTEVMHNAITTVREVIHGNYQLLQDANAWVQAGSGEFVNPLLFQGTGNYSPYVGDVKHGVGDSTLGLRREIRFGGAKFMERL